MLLSSASATLHAPSVSAVAITNCLLSEYGLRDMAGSFTAVAVKRNDPGAYNNVTLLQVLSASTRSSAAERSCVPGSRCCLCTRVATLGAIGDVPSHTCQTAAACLICPLE